MTITDPQKLSNFMSDNGNFVGADLDFTEYSDLDIKYNVGLSMTGSPAHALAYALENSGITLLKQANPPLLPELKKIGVEEKIINGQIIIEKSDCE